MDKNRRWALLAGGLAGLVNGLFGGGGGAVLLPMLRDKCLPDTRQALATCVGVMVPVCALSAALQWESGAAEAALPYLLGGLAGGVIAGRTLKRANPKLLRKIFALLLLWSGVRAWL